VTHLPSFDLIIGSDLVYAIDVLDLLAKTICDLSHAHTKALIAYEVRWKDVEKWFLEALEIQQLKLREIPHVELDSNYCYEKLKIIEIVKK
jgi:hypothetical protein